MGAITSSQLVFRLFGKLGYVLTRGVQSVSQSVSRIVGSLVALLTVVASRVIHHRIKGDMLLVFEW